MASLQPEGAVPAAGLEPERGTETESAEGGVLDRDPPPDDVHFRRAPRPSFLLTLPFSAPAFHVPFGSLRSYLCVTLVSLLL